MRNEADKAGDELRAFHAFAERSPVPINLASIQKRPAGEPDILCEYLNGGSVAFEVSELCDESIAKTINSRSEQFAAFATSDPSLRIFRKKRSCQYETNYPIELLLYTAGRTITPDEVIVATVRASAECNSGPYRRIWFMGEAIVELIYAAV